MRNGGEAELGERQTAEAVFAQTVVGAKLLRLGERRLIKKMASDTKEGELLDKGFVDC